MCALEIGKSMRNWLSYRFFCFSNWNFVEMFRHTVLYRKFFWKVLRNVS